MDNRRTSFVVLPHHRLIEHGVVVPGRVAGDEPRWDAEAPKHQRCGRGELFNEGPQLPLPPMLMFDRISEIAEAGGQYGKGLVRAVLDLKPDLWFFPCHFKGDPVMPGCLGIDALWQMLGFFLGWLGSPGKGRALGLGELKLSGQVLPNVRQVIYGIDIKRVMRSKLVLGIADGWLKADGSIIYRAMDLKVGLFRLNEQMQPSRA